MRIAFVSDIHGNLLALDAVIKDIHRRGVDKVVNLGDSLSGPLLPLETAQLLMTQNWYHLAGNHERQILFPGPGKPEAADEFARTQLTDKELHWIAALLPSYRYSSKIYLCHGTPASDCDYFLETVTRKGVRIASAAEVELRLGGITAELIACGHTHTPRVMRTSAGQLIVNPGSVGLQAYSDKHPHAHAIETGSPDARYAIVERTRKSWDAVLVSVSYAHKAMAQLAQTRQRPDWAHALMTGYAA